MHTGVTRWVAGKRTGKVSGGRACARWRRTRGACCGGHHGRRDASTHVELQQLVLAHLLPVACRSRLQAHGWPAAAAVVCRHGEGACRLPSQGLPAPGCAQRLLAGTSLKLDDSIRRECAGNEAGGWVVGGRLLVAGWRRYKQGRRDESNACETSALRAAFRHQVAAHPRGAHARAASCAAAPCLPASGDPACIQLLSARFAVAALQAAGPVSPRQHETLTAQC